MRSFPQIWAVVLLVGCGKDEVEPPDVVGPGMASVPDEFVGADNAELASDGLVTCADPSLRDALRFERRQYPSPANSEIWVWAGGAIAADFDDDGNIDLVAPSESTSKIYWGTASGSFVEATLPFELSMGIGGTAADHDGDGDLDLYITRYAEPNVLLRNDGNRQFADVTAEAGVACLVPANATYPGYEDNGVQCVDPVFDGTMKGGMSMASSWADYDADGDLDLFVGNYGYVDHSVSSATEFGPAEPSCLYANNGDGTFTDVTEALLPNDEFCGLHYGYTYVAGWHDLNDDGLPELYSVNDFGTSGFPNRLLWNDGGTFRMDNGAHGLDLPTTGMGLGINDVNGDGVPDILMPVWNNIELLESKAFGSDPVWLDVSGAKGITVASARGQKVGWGAELEDMDNDADLDAVVAFGFVDDLGNPVWDNPFKQPDGLYLQTAGTFTDQGESWGTADSGVSRGFVVVDINRDGWLDIAKRDLVGPNVFYVSRCGAEAWLTVELRQPTTLNSRAIGAKITVIDGETQQVRWIRAGGTSHASGGPPEVHFGFGAGEDLAAPDGTLDIVEVRWPDGTTSVFQNVAPRQHLVITRTE